MTDHWNTAPHLLPETMTSAVTDAVADAVARTEPQPEPWNQYGTQTWTATLTVSRSFTGPEGTQGIPVAPPAAHGQPAYGRPAYGQPAYGQPAYGEPGYGQAAVYAQPVQGTHPQPAPAPAPAALPPHREPLQLPAAPDHSRSTGRDATGLFEPDAFQPAPFGSAPYESAPYEAGPYQPAPYQAPYQASPYGSSQYQPPQFEPPAAGSQHASSTGYAAAPRTTAPTRPTRPASRAPLPPIDTWTHDREPIVIRDPWDVAAERAGQVALREDAPRAHTEAVWPTASALAPRAATAPVPRGANGVAAAEAHARALTVVAQPERAPERAVYRDPAPMFHKTRSPLALRMVLTLAIVLCCLMAGIRAHVGGLDTPDNSTVTAHLPAFLGGAATP